jgi:hypothetical protein
LTRFGFGGGRWGDEGGEGDVGDVGGLFLMKSCPFPQKKLQVIIRSLGQRNNGVVISKSKRIIEISNVNRLWSPRWTISVGGGKVNGMIGNGKEKGKKWNESKIKTSG